MKELSVIFSRHLMPPFASNPIITQLFAQIFPVPPSIFPNIFAKYVPIIPPDNSVVGFCVGHGDAKADELKIENRPTIRRKIF